MSESPTAGAPKVTQIGTQSGPGASSTLPEASSSIHSLSTFEPVDGTYMEQQQTHHSPLMYTTSNSHTLHDVECDSQTFPDPKYQRSYPCSEFDPQCSHYPGMAVPPQTTSYSRLLQQPFSPFQQNIHSGGHAGAGDVDRTENLSLEKKDRAQGVNGLSLEISGTKTVVGRPRKTYVKTNRVLRSQKSLKIPDGENGGRQGDANRSESYSDEEERLTPTKKKRGGQAKRKKASV
ncbi:hypothetical protein BJV82DRAFT_667770 [Fennellomyces sp. T-0311]|nr:hypothetical protein BJV82DRAFT_667770 [Fennellomyces sp. T-0311]